MMDLAYAMSIVQKYLVNTSESNFLDSGEHTKTKTEFKAFA